jgi:hypothetical protein
MLSQVNPMFSVVKLNVIMLSAVMLNVLAPPIVNTNFTFF